MSLAIKIKYSSAKNYSSHVTSMQVGKSWDEGLSIDSTAQIFLQVR
jgi:hypothetical protein